MPSPDKTRKAPPCDPILAEAVVATRMLQLSELQQELAAAEVQCVLARNHRLVLRYNVTPCKPSGLTNPELHIFAPGGNQAVTSDGTTYRLGSEEFAVADPAKAAAQICQSLDIVEPA